MACSKAKDEIAVHAGGHGTVTGHYFWFFFFFAVGEVGGLHIHLNERHQTEYICSYEWMETHL